MDREEMLRQMVEDYRRKVETYQAMIREWETELGNPGVPLIDLMKMGGAESKKTSATSGEPISKVRDFQFFGKSQPEAAKLFLELVGHPLKTTEIIEGIEKGGVKVGGKTPKDKKTNLYTILHRSDDFATVTKDTWGLTTWPGVKKEKDAKEDELPEDKKG